MLYEHVDGHAKFAYNDRTHLLYNMEYLDKDLLADEETWAAIFAPALCENSAAVESLARLLLTIMKAIDSGPEGAMRASRTLLNGIELIYLHTNAHKAALRLYVLSLEGNLKPQDEPLRLINAAVERGTGRTR